MDECKECLGGLEKYDEGWVKRCPQCRLIASHQVWEMLERLAKENALLKKENEELKSLTKV